MNDPRYPAGADTDLAPWNRNELSPVTFDALEAALLPDLDSALADALANACSEVHAASLLDAIWSGDHCEVGRLLSGVKEYLLVNNAEKLADNGFNYEDVKK